MSHTHLSPHVQNSMCSCYITDAYRVRGGWEGSIRFCAMHKTAPELLATLKRCIQFGDLLDELKAEAQAAVAHAEGLK